MNDSQYKPRRVDCSTLGDYFWFQVATPPSQPSKLAMICYALVFRCVESLFFSVSCGRAFFDGGGMFELHLKKLPSGLGLPQVSPHQNPRQGAALKTEKKNNIK